MPTLPGNVAPSAASGKSAPTAAAVRSGDTLALISQSLGFYPVDGSVAIAGSPVVQQVADGWASGLAGTAGVRILSTDGTQAVARTSAVTEPVAGSGVYFVTLTAPATPGRYVVVADTGTVSSATVAARDLLVLNALPLGPAGSSAPSSKPGLDSA